MCLTPTVISRSIFIGTEPITICDRFHHFLSDNTLPKNVSVKARWKFKLIILIIPILFQEMPVT